MKIIKRGNPPEKRTWKGECRNCGCVLEAEQKELVLKYDQRESSDWGEGKCPECKSTVIFYEKKA